MTVTLQEFIARDLAAEVPAEVSVAARTLADRLGGIAVLFYGSVLRTRAMEDILDFYVLTEPPEGNVVRHLGLGRLWPDVSYHEIEIGSGTIRAKVATMPLATFAHAATGAMLDTTIWTRFAQPAALVWAARPGDRLHVVRAVTDAVTTAGRFAAAVGPRVGRTDEYWAALLRETYRAELRVEAPGREMHILEHAPERYDRLLPLAWHAAGIRFKQQGTALSPLLDFNQSLSLTQAWLTRAAFGKVLNIARLVKAAFTFEGAARYGARKIERHTGVRVRLTPWRERHPLLTGPIVLWRVLRASAR